MSAILVSRCTFKRNKATTPDNNMPLLTDNNSNDSNDNLRQVSANNDGFKYKETHFYLLGIHLTLFASWIVCHI